MQMLVRMNRWPKGERFSLSLPISGVIQFPENRTELNLSLSGCVSFADSGANTNVRMLAFVVVFVGKGVEVSMVHFVWAFSQLEEKKIPELWTWCEFNRSKTVQFYKNHIYLPRPRPVKNARFVLSFLSISLVF